MFTEEMIVLLSLSHNKWLSQNSNNDYYFNSKNDDAYNGDD